MATKTITFTNPINVSVQVTDILCGVNPDTTTKGFKQAGTNNPFGTSKPQKLGKVTSVDHGSKQIVIDDSGFTSFSITTSTVLFFSKDRRVNSSGLIGYYSLAEYRNSSKKKAEVFAVSTEYAPSSK